MISSAFALKEATMIPDNFTKLPETKLENNYFLTSLNFLEEMNKEILACKRDFYKTILESANSNNEINEYTINESTNEILHKLKLIVKKIIAYIEILVKKFVTQLSKYISSDRYILRMKDQIKKFNDEDEFTVNGFNFTFKSTIPMVDIEALNSISQVNAILSSSNSMTVKAAKIAELNETLASESIMSDIRAQIIQSDEPIQESAFANELFCVYRDNTTEEVTLAIKKKEVLNALDRYEGFKKTEKEVRSTQINIEKKYKMILKDIDNLSRDTIRIDGSNKSDMSDAEQNAINIIINKNINTLVNLMNRVSALHVQAFAAKLDALAAEAVLNRNILYTALRKVQSHMSNTKTMGESSLDYVSESAYREYVINKYYLNMDQKHFVEECLALSESNIPELKYINEDLKMDVKGKIDKLIQLVKEIFNKFLVKMDSLLGSNKKYLEQNKETILTKKPPEPYTLNNFPDYETGIKNIKGHKLQRMDIKAILSDSENDIRKKLLPSYDGSDDFAEFAKRYFLCGNKPNTEKVSSTTLDMKDIYAFCIEAQAAINTLKADANSFTQEANTMKSAVLSSIKESTLVDLGQKYYYSTVLESYVNEDGEKESTISGGNNPDSKAKGDAKLDLKVTSSDNDNKSDNQNISKDVKQDDDDKGKDIKTQQDENKDSDRKKVEETADWYLSALRTVCTAKITAFQKIYVEYMKIIRYHVSQVNKTNSGNAEFKEEEIQQITNAMKEYKNAKSDDERKAAADKLINIYGGKGIKLDAHGVQSLVNKNASKL